MVEYTDCKWCGGRIQREDGGPWVHRRFKTPFCQQTKATPPDYYGRCTECWADDWRTCGCTHIVTQVEANLDSGVKAHLRILNEEKQSGQ